MDHPKSSSPEAMFSSNAVPSNSFFAEPPGYGANRRLSLLEEQPESIQKLSSSSVSAVHPSVPAFRRTRAETFSSFPSKLLPDDHIPSLAPIGSSHGGSGGIGGRVRSGSLSLPANDLALAFGPSLFSTWQPSTSPNMPSSGFAGVDMDGTGPTGGAIPSGSQVPGNVSLNGGNGQGGAAGATGTSPSLYASSRPTSNLVSHAALADSMGTLTEESAVARTLDYLGLDDNDAGMMPRRTSSGNPSSATNALHMGQFLRSHTSPRLQGLDILNSTMAPAPSSTAAALLPFSHLRQHHQQHQMGHSRSRSYSVAVGETFSFNMPSSNPGPVYRPRSSSIAHIELNSLEFSIAASSLLAQSSKRESPDLNMEISPPDLSQGHMGNSYLDQPTQQQMSALNLGTPTGTPNASSMANGGNTTMAPSRSLWIGNIDANLSPADLLATFSPFGPIESLRILPERECAFVNYVRTEDAVIAREALQGARIGGSPQGPGSFGVGPSAAVKIGFGKVEAIGDTQGMQPTKSLWVGNIPPSTEPAELEAIFAAFGPVESARVLTHKNCGFINFDRLEDAMEARKTMNGKDIGGCTVKIGYAKVPGKSGQNDGFSVQFGAGGVVSGVNGVNDGSDNIVESLDGQTPAILGDDTYASALSTLPEPMANRKVDQARLREMRKRLEGHVPPKEVETMFHEILSETIDLCTDYIGNVVVQKILEKSPDNHRVALMEQISPHMAVIGVHKNGTWVVQKMIDIAKTPAQMAVIVNSLKKYTPPLLLDQFGNYVVQCCLRMGPQRNQFIFDAMHTKIVDIGFGRFGARAVRACLESQYTTKRQQKHVAMSIVQNAGQLVTNPNGAILVTWLLDTSSLPGRYRVIAPKLVPFVAAFCNHKLASSTILKLVNQRIELDAREVIIKELFFRDENILREVLSDFSHGVSTIQKILSTACVTPEERVRLADRVRLVLSRLPEVQENPVGFKRLLDELAAIPSSLSLNDPSPLNSHDIVSPLTPHAGFFANPLANNANPNGGYYTGPGGHPTPNHSPQPMGMGGPGYYTTSPSTGAPPYMTQVPGGYSMVASAGPPWGMGQPAPYGLHPYHAVQQGGGQYNQMQSSSQS